MLRLKVPRLRNPNIVFRLTNSAAEVERAEKLVLENYMGVGLWSDSKELTENNFLHSSRRTCFVAVEGDRLLATASIVTDSVGGLPADKFQPHVMKRIRGLGDRLAEVSALAVDSHTSQSREIVLFLFSFITQFSFFYAGLDRFTISTTEKHARFYKSVFGFQTLTEPAEHYYVNVKGQLLTVNLLQARIGLAETYGVESEVVNSEAVDFYHFLFNTVYEFFRFPVDVQLRRRRDRDWLREARLFLQMPIAV